MRGGQAKRAHTMPSARSSHGDHKSSHSYPAHLHRVSTDFNLLPEIRELGDAFNGTRRLELQMRRWRNGATFGMLENKLLGHSFLDALDVPQVATLYGGFASRAMGRWPRYEAASLVKAIHGSHRFVLKAASGGGAEGVLVMTPERWQRENWTELKVVEFAEQIIRRPCSLWGQRFEHAGVVVQESVWPDGDTIFQVEVKAHVVFGKLGKARLFIFPAANESVVGHKTDPNRWGGRARVSYCEQTPKCKIVSQGPVARRADKSMCGKLVMMLSQSSAQVSRMAKKVAAAVAADWFRFDFFLTEQRGGGIRLLVNEVTYPSHIIDRQHTCSNARLLSTYQQATIESVDSTTLLYPLLERIGVSHDDFFARPDFLQMHHASDEWYHAQGTWHASTEQLEAELDRTGYWQSQSQLIRARRCSALSLPSNPPIPKLQGSKR